MFYKQLKTWQSAGLCFFYGALFFVTRDLYVELHELGAPMGTVVAINWANQLAVLLLLMRYAETWLDFERKRFNKLMTASKDLIKEYDELHNEHHELIVHARELHNKLDSEGNEWKS